MTRCCKYFVESVLKYQRKLCMYIGGGGGILCMSMFIIAKFWYVVYWIKEFKTHPYT